jgi:hypothetical protein
MSLDDKIKDIREKLSQAMNSAAKATQHIPQQQPQQVLPRWQTHAPDKTETSRSANGLIKMVRRIWYNPDGTIDATRTDTVADEHGNELLTKYAEYFTLAVGHGSYKSEEATMRTLALILLDQKLAQVNTVTERVVVADPINQAMSEVYKP